MLLVWELGCHAYGFHIRRLEVVGEIGFQMPAKSETRTRDTDRDVTNSNYASDHDVDSVCVQHIGVDQEFPEALGQCIIRP